MRIGLSLLCEQPNRQTGLTSLFTAFVKESLRLCEEVEFVIFCAEGQTLGIPSSRVTEVNGFPANDRLLARLATEHLRIGPAARDQGCEVLMTTGLVPVRAGLPVAMHLLTLHHLSASNRVSWPRATYRNWASRRGLRKASLVITNTLFACRQILSVDSRVGPKLLQSYEGIDHHLFHPHRGETERIAEQAGLRERHGIPERYYFWCSNFYPYKQADLLMEAWCDLPESLRQEVPLVMAGGGGWGDSKERTKGIVDRRGAGAQVKMLGWVSDEEVPVLFRNASVFVHPSREETFGRSVLEAMASGVPCVVQNIPVMPEVTGGHALSIDYADRAAASQALERGLTDERWRAQTITEGLRHARSFSFERLAGERLHALFRVLGRSVPNSLKRFAPVFADSIA